VTIFQYLVIVTSLSFIGVGVHNLQFRLERWDHERHLND
jgi:hypothetical protein